MQQTTKILLGTSILLLSGTMSFMITSGPSEEHPELAIVPAGSYLYRISGEFLKKGSPVDAPQKELHFSRDLKIMKFQVSRKNYARCVAENACQSPLKQSTETITPNEYRPVTGVSYIDAINYAQWLSAKTGTTWRLPTDAEWAYAAGSRFFDDTTGIEISSNDPSRQMLSKYKQSIDLKGNADSKVRLRGGYGANENGIFDQSGNIWEWTETCYTRSEITITGQDVTDDNDNCGVRVVEGRHRSYMPVFIKDAKSGGCGVGTPPDYLGFRLVKDNPPFFSLRRIQNWLKLVT